MSKRLTEVYIKTVKPPATNRLTVVDSEVPGLSFRVTSHGARSWLVRYRVKGRPGQRNTSPGPYPAVCLADARQRAREVITAAKRGVDLIEQEHQDAARTAAAAAARPDTVAGVAQEFIKRGLEAKGRAPSYIAATRRMFNEHVEPKWGARDIRSITRRDVVALLDSIADDGKPIVANRMLAAVRAMFNWAVRRGIVDASPASLVEPPAEEKARERTLSADEIRLIWPRLEALGYPFGHFLRLALTTGQRRDEVARMRWADIDLNERTWTLSSDQTKAGRAHVVPLSPPAVEILVEAKQAACLLHVEGKDGEAGEAKLGPFVFTTTGDRPISGYSKAKTRVDTAIANARAEAELQSDMEAWTIHDLRRTVGTGLGKLGVSRFIISRILNHADATVTGIYDRHEYLAEKRHALEAWATYLSNVTAPAGANLVPLRGSV